MEKDIICIVCPLSCSIRVSGEAGELISSGYSCKRGKEYAEQEYLHPERILTSIVAVDGPGTSLLPVRTDRPVPRDMQLACMEVIKGLVVTGPVKMHDVILKNILGTGANLVATTDLPM